MDEWLSAEQVQTGWGKEDFEILNAIKQKELRAYDKKRQEKDYCKISPDQFDADYKNKCAIESAKRGAAANPKFGELEFRMIRFGGLHIALSDCIFKKGDIVRLWGEMKEPNNKIGTAGASKLSASKMADSQFFKAAIEGTVALLLHCQKQDPPMIRKDGESFLYHHNKSITEKIFRVIWNAMPEELKAKDGRPKKKKP